MNKQKLIQRTKNCISNLSAQQQSSYNALVDYLEIQSESRLDELLWDYLFNYDTEETFVSFLARFGTADELFLPDTQDKTRQRRRFKRSDRN